MDVIRLSLPASPRHAATARVVTASLAADAGFDVDAIDDLRLAVNEAVAILTDDAGDGTGDDPTPDSVGTLDVEFQVEPGRVDVELRGETGTAPVELDDLARTILSAVVDRYEVDDRTVRLSKSVASTSPGRAGTGHDR